MTNTQVSTRQDARPPSNNGGGTLRERAVQIISGVSEIVGNALPSGVTMDQFRDTFIMAANHNRDIFKCDLGSLQNALVASAKAGLVPDNQLGALVPFKEKRKGRNGEKDTWIDKVQFIVMVKGYVKLFKERCGVHEMAVQVVYAKDRFKYIEGDNPLFEHEPDIFAKDRGERVGVYAQFRDKDGNIMHREILRAVDVEAARSVSKMKDSGPWANFTDEMWKKTAIRRASKYLPMPDEVRRIIEAEDDPITLDAQPARPANYNPLARASGLDAQPPHDNDGVIIDGDYEPDNGEYDAGQDDERSGEAGETSEPRAATDKEIEEAIDAGKQAAIDGNPDSPPEGYLPAQVTAFHKGFKSAAPKEGTKG